MKTTVKMRPFDVRIPNLEGDGIAEIIRIEIPVRLDAATGEEILTPEAHDLIEKTRARRMGLMLPDELRQLRERLRLTQEEMSDLLQIGAKTYTRWESGRARPSRSMNVLLCSLRDGRTDVNYLRRLRDPGAEPEWPAKDWARMVLAGCRVPVPPVEFQEGVAHAFAAWLARHDVFEERTMPLLTVRSGMREFTAIQRRRSNRGTWIVESQQEFPRAIGPKRSRSNFQRIEVCADFDDQPECEDTQTTRAA